MPQRFPRPSSYVRSIWSNDVFIAILVMVVALLIFRAGSYIEIGDARWTFHTAYSLLKGNGGFLDEYLVLIEANQNYAIRYVGQSPYNYFPIGGALFALPFAVFELITDSGFAAELSQSLPVEVQASAAMWLMAFAAALLYLSIKKAVSNRGIALACVLAFCCGSSVLSQATRQFWNQTPVILMHVVAIYILVAAQKKESAIIYLGVPLALAFITRPTAIVEIVLFSVYVAWRHRAYFISYLAWGAVIACLWFLYNWSAYQSLVPFYYLPSRGTSTDTFWLALAGNLISPARGLLVFSPWVVFALFAPWRVHCRNWVRDLCFLFLACIILHWLLVARFPHWWGGFCYGPRMMMDVLPYLAFMFGVQLSAMRRNGAITEVVFVAIGISLFWSVLIHNQAAISSQPHNWNIYPVSVDVDTDRIWDWSDPQFARGLFEWSFAGSPEATKEPL